MSADVSYPPLDVSTLMPRAEAEQTIGGFEARIAALEGKKAFAQIATATVGETLGLGLTLGVRRYVVDVPGVALTDRILALLGGAPTNGTLQNAYVSAANKLTVEVLVPQLAIGAKIEVPVVFYKVA